MKLNKVRHERAFIGAAAAALVIIEEGNLANTLPEAHKVASDKALFSISLLLDLVLNNQKLTASDITWCVQLIDLFDTDVEKLSSGVYSYSTLLLYAKFLLTAAVEVSVDGTVRSEHQYTVKETLRIISMLCDTVIGHITVGNIHYDVASYLARKFRNLMEVHNV